MPFQCNYSVTTNLENGFQELKVQAVMHVFEMNAHLLAVLCAVQGLAFSKMIAETCGLSQAHSGESIIKQKRYQYQQVYSK